MTWRVTMQCRQLLTAEEKKSKKKLSQEQSRCKVPVCFCGSFFSVMGRQSPRFGNESCLRILLPLCIVFMANVRKDAYLRSRYTAGGDKEWSLWINRKKSDGVVEKCPEISYTKK